MSLVCAEAAAASASHSLGTQWCQFSRRTPKRVEEGRDRFEKKKRGAVRKARPTTAR